MWYWYNLTDTANMKISYDISISYTWIIIILEHKLFWKASQIENFDILPRQTSQELAYSLCGRHLASPELFFLKINYLHSLFRAIQTQSSSLVFKDFKL